MNKLKNNIKQTAILLVAILSFTPTFAKTKVKTAKAIIKTHFNCDHCKKCETCGLKFEAELYITKGIKTFSIDEKAMTIAVIYNPKRVDLRTIKTAISKLGFDADEVKADPMAYEKLDDCCKK
jgi:periplasmic mercuric ion binding protein